jgi:hypothetical protein
VTPNAAPPATHPCPRCQRVNPAGAAYCHFDGNPLGPGAGRLGHGQLPHEFVFPSGRSCRTYDDLVRACQEEWDQARTLLRQGVFAQFLTGAGRADLAQAAARAQAHDDPDIGLHVFLTGLPASRVEGPKLDLHPRRLALGTLRCGETRQLQLNVSNLGKGLLQGTITVAAGGEWMRFEGPGTDRSHCTLKTAREQHVHLRVDTKALAARQSYNGKLTVITNGGIVEVPVSLEMAAVPFHKQPFAGAASPREMAERMRAQPKAAVPLLESGEVARWFTANGWVYPVPVSTARGVAAVQQFFEGMGLSKAPALELSQTEAHFLCVAPEVAHGQVTLRTPTRKWVYATVDSDVPWLKVTTPAVSGPQQADVEYEVDSGLMEANQVHHGTVQLLANAGQKLLLRVTVDVRRPEEPFTRRLLRPFFAGALLALVYRFLLAVPADLYARVWASPLTNAGQFESWLLSPLEAPQGQADLAVPVATLFVRHFVLLTWWVGAVLGAVVLWRRGGRSADVLAGVVAGAVAGLLGSATFACLLPVLDLPPRLVFKALALLGHGQKMPGSAWLWTPVWVLTASAWWTLAGGCLGWALRLAGQRGRALLTGLAAPVALVARWCGAADLSGFFAFSE